MSAGRKITIHTIAGEETPDFFFLGVVSAEPDYRLSVMINRHLGTDLRKCPDEISLQTSSGRHTFTRFTSGAPDFSLVSNRSEGKILLRKLKNIDFVLFKVWSERQAEGRRTGGKPQGDPGNNRSICL